MLTEEKVDIVKGERRLLLLLVKQQLVIWIKICHEHGDMRLGDVERKTTADEVAFRSTTNDKDQRQSIFALAGSKAVEKLSGHLCFWMRC